MHLLGSLLMLIIMLTIILMPVACAVHALKTGRDYWWLWIIIMAPGIGCLVYFIVEVLPEVRRSPTLRRVGGDVIEMVYPGRALRNLEEDLEVAGTFKNRQMLARGYVKAKRYDEAIELYEQCLTGVLADDPCARLEMAYTHFLNQSYDQTEELLGQLAESHPTFRKPERSLLYARALEQAGDIERAIEEYAGLVKISAGEESRCRYAMLLTQNGRHDEAQKIFQEILRRAKRSPRYYRRAQREWIALAKRNLKT